MKPASINRLIGVSSILAAALITIISPCPTSAGYFLIYTLTGIGIALLLYRRGDRSSLSVRLQNIGILLSGAVALPFILFFTNPIDKFRKDSCSLLLGMTVFVHGKRGKQDMILRQKGYVIMDVGNERKKAPIEENGAAHFENLRPGDSVRINIDFSEPYLSIHPDSIYIIQPGTSIYLEVALSGIDNVRGKVIYRDSPLAGVTVEIDTLSTQTGKDGGFSLSIPPGLQKNRYEVWLQKEGFKMVKAAAYPETGQPLEVIMEKSN